VDVLGERTRSDGLEVSSPGHRPICVVLGLLPAGDEVDAEAAVEIESMVEAMRATIAGGMVSTATVA
jgi:hypothetical protein